MPLRASHLPSYRERCGLQQLLGGRELTAADLHPANSNTIKNMLAKGWIESGSSDSNFRITLAGEAALRAELPMRGVSDRFQTRAEGKEMKSLRWSPEEDGRLRKLARSGLSSVEIAHEMGRSKSSVYARAVKLNIVIARGRNPMQAQPPASG